jgi:DNA polymerase-3 subunit epsilon
MLREIVLDTETTGLDPKAGHRIIELACLELVNHLPTGAHFQRYLNPERDVPADAEAIHGITSSFLADKPLFRDVADEFLSFIGDAKLVIHNAEFDLNFLNAELKLCGLAAIPTRRGVDTVTLARRKFPGQPASLDALCQRFGIDNSKRNFHGALLDAELLAEVYLQLIGGRQASIELVATAKTSNSSVRTMQAMRVPRSHAANDAETTAHAALLDRLKNPIWRQEG